MNRYFENHPARLPTAVERNEAEPFLRGRKKQAGTAGIWKSLSPMSQSSQRSAPFLLFSLFAFTCELIGSPFFLSKFSCIGNPSTSRGTTCPSQFQEMEAPRKKVGVAQRLTRSLDSSVHGFSSKFHVRGRGHREKQTRLLSLPLRCLRGVPHSQLVLFTSPFLCAASSQSWSGGFCSCLLFCTRMARGSQTPCQAPTPRSAVPQGNEDCPHH